MPSRSCRAEISCWKACGCGEQRLLSAFFSSHSKSNSNWPSNRSACLRLSILILLSCPAHHQNWHPWPLNTKCFGLINGRLHNGWRRAALSNYLKSEVDRASGSANGRPPAILAAKNWCLLLPLALALLPSGRHQPSHQTLQPSGQQSSANKPNNIRSLSGPRFFLLGQVSYLWGEKPI